jgi:acetyl esterase
VVVTDERDSRPALDPELAAVVESFETECVPPWHAMSVESARRVEDELFSQGSGPPMEMVREFAVSSPNGSVPLRIYRPTAASDRPVLTFAHGGGWTLGTLDSADDVCRELAGRVGCVVASVDYRLAPEHPFPAALDDVHAALSWVGEHAGSVGGDPGRVGVAGTSAGGNLAAATARRAVEHDSLDLACQLLLYPMVGGEFASLDPADGPLLSRADVEWFWAQYLRSPVDRANPYARLLEAREFEGLPPAVVATAGHDPLRDEGRAYARELADAGVDVAAHDFPTLAHGFCSLTGKCAAADRALDAVAESVRARL